MNSASGPAFLIQGVAGYFEEVTVVCIGKAAIGIFAGGEDNITGFMQCGFVDVIGGDGNLLYQV